MLNGGYTFEKYKYSVALPYKEGDVILNVSGKLSGKSEGRHQSQDQSTYMYKYRASVWLIRLPV